MDRRTQKFILVAFLLSAFLGIFVIAHNLLSAMLGFEEPFFLSLAIITVFLIPFHVLYLLGFIFLRCFGFIKK